jgi:hypothetical protein
VAIQISSGTRQPSAIQMRRRLEFVRPLFLDNSSSFITIDVKKMFQFHDFSELCSALQFSGFRNFHFRHFGIFGLRVFGTRDFGFSAPGSSFCSDSQPFIISIPEFRKFGFLIPRAHNIVVVLKIRYDSSVFGDFGTSGLRVSGFRSTRILDLLSFPTPDFRNSDLLYPPDPHRTMVTHNHGGTWHVHEGPRRF